VRRLMNSLYFSFSFPEFLSISIMPVSSKSDELGSMVGIVLLWRVTELSPIVIFLSVSIPRIIGQERF